MDNIYISTGWLACLAFVLVGAVALTFRKALPPSLRLVIPLAAGAFACVTVYATGARIWMASADYMKANSDHNRVLFQMGYDYWPEDFVALNRKLSEDHASRRKWIRAHVKLVETVMDRDAHYAANAEPFTIDLALKHRAILLETARDVYGDDYCDGLLTPMARIKGGSPEVTRANSNLAQLRMRAMIEGREAARQTPPATQLDYDLLLRFMEADGPPPAELDYFRTAGKGPACAATLAALHSLRTHDDPALDRIGRQWIRFRPVAAPSLASP